MQERFNQLDLKKWWLAEELGLNQKTIQRWFNGTIKQVKIENLTKLSSILECEVEHLVLLEEHDKESSPAEIKEILDLIEIRDIYSIMLSNGNLDFLDRVLRSLHRSNSTDLLTAYIYMYRGYCASLSHKELRAMEFSEKSLNIAKKLKNDFLIYGSLLNMATTSAKLGDLNTALQQFDQCKKIVQESKHLSVVQQRIIEINRAQAYLRHGLYSKGLEVLKVPDSLPKKVQHSSRFDRLLIQGQLYFQNGDVNLALECFEQILAETLEIISKNHSFISKCYLARIYFLKGNHRSAKKLYSECKELATHLASTGNIYYISCISPLDFHFLGFTSAKKIHQAQEANILKQCKLNHAFFYRSLSRLYHLGDDLKNAKKLSRKAQNIYSQLNAQGLLAECQKDFQSN